MSLFPAGALRAPWKRSLILSLQEQI